MAGRQHGQVGALVLAHAGNMAIVTHDMVTDHMVTYDTW